MLKDIEKTKEMLKVKRKDEEYKDLLYDLESFIIDLSFADDIPAERQAYLGKKELMSAVVNEKETEVAFSKIRPVLLELGIREETKGFRILEALVLEAARCILAGKTYNMKSLYPLVANNFGVSGYNCERLARYACNMIQIADDFSAKYPFLELLTHRTYERVTVKELVDALAQYLVFKCRFKSKYQNK